MNRKKGEENKICICTDGTKYKFINSIAKSLNWRIVGEEEDWNVRWKDSAFDLKIAHRMRRFQRINHFPGMHELSRKDLLCRHMSRMEKLHPAEYNFFPRTWIFPADLPEARQFAKGAKRAIFILKPDNGAQGNGISLLQSLSDVNPFVRMVCQEYIQMPFLFDGYKFDLRVYVLVTSIEPLRIYVYRDGLVRIATQLYSKPTETNMACRYMHLTNCSVNKMNDRRRSCCLGTKRSFADLSEMLRRQGVNDKILWNKIDDIIAKTMIGAYAPLSRSYRTTFPSHSGSSACFEILGFDIILNESLEPFLLEVNHSPSFNLDEPTDRIVKIGLLKDTLRLLCVSADDKSRIFREDSDRIRSRSQKLTTRIDYASGDSYVCRNQNAADDQKWEEENLGNFRVVMPNPEKNEAYIHLMKTDYEMFSVYSGTKSSVARAAAVKEEFNSSAKHPSSNRQKPIIRARRPPKCARNVKAAELIEGIRSEKRSLRGNRVRTNENTLTENLLRKLAWDARKKYIASFGLTALIYESFYINDLLSKRDMDKYSFILKCSK